jgi:hypothetical protein
MRFIHAISQAIKPIVTAVQGGRGASRLRCEVRNRSGVHWRISDSVNGLLHGEEGVIRIPSEAKHAYPEPSARFMLTKFDGTTITV